MVTLSNDEIDLLKDRKMNMDDFLANMAIFAERAAHYPKEEVAWLRRQIIADGTKLDSPYIHNIRIARKGRKEEEEAFDSDLNSFLRMSIFDVMRVEKELGPSPHGYTYRFGYNASC